MSATWKHLAGFYSAEDTPTAPEPSGTTIKVPIPHQVWSETAQNTIGFVQDFEPNYCINSLTDAPDIPIQASVGDTSNNHAVLNVGSSSHG